MRGFFKRTASVVVSAMLILALIPMWTFSTAASEVFYTHTFTSVPAAGDNVLGTLTWNFSMAGYGTIESGSSGRGARFSIGDDPSHELIIKTTVNDVSISGIVVEAAMGSGSDTKLSITVGGKTVASDVAVSNVNKAYAFAVNGQSGEIVIRLSATVAGKLSYIKSITIYTGEPSTTAKTNYHNHTYRCRHAGSYTDREYIEAAISNGYTAIGFSDHVMLPYITYENSVRGIYWESTEYYNTICALQNEYQGKIDILLGWESEWALGGLFEDYYRYLVDNNLVDYLILGNHWQIFDTSSNRFIAPLEDEAHELENVQNYVAGAIEALDTGLFTIMAHPEIFFVKGYGNVQNFTPVMKDLVRAMCEKAKEKGVALELNQGYIDNMETLERYTEFWKIVKEVGNTVVIGVDAHYPGAYNESVRNRVISFANKIGLTLTMDLGITRKTPKNVPLFRLEGQYEPTDANYVAIAKENLTWGSIRGLNASENAVTLPLALPSSFRDCTVTWSSDQPAVISNAEP